VHLVGPYYANISRCTAHGMSNITFHPFRNFHLR